jgi:hypothetical protein
MRELWRMIGGLLLVAVATALTDSQALAIPASQAIPLHPAGCHGQAPASPSPLPSSPSPSSPLPHSYQCCVNGHHAAIPSAAFSIRSISAQLYTCDADERARLNLDSYLNSERLLSSSTSPPGLFALRI